MDTQKRNQIVDAIAFTGIGIGIGLGIAAHQLKKKIMPRMDQLQNESAATGYATGVMTERVRNSDSYRPDFRTDEVERDHAFYRMEYFNDFVNPQE